MTSTQKSELTRRMSRQLVKTQGRNHSLYVDSSYVAEQRKKQQLEEETDKSRTKTERLKRA